MKVSNAQGNSRSYRRYLRALDDRSHIPCSVHFQVLFIKQASLSCSISHEDTPLLSRLYVGLEVASYTIADSDVGKVTCIEQVSMLSSQL